ncbi:MAG: GNAT family N-acetyltransferase [Cyanobacteria bacterium SZAS LIN-2]|nr:GNAT family N-acetyltransferase [Cyanobacteria bacterium SZAS LIN-3]MBS1995622.1 GNAT family N-acetyltransferase [Cyanobacteria bacterium SZAS LIN-2]
MNQSTSTTAVSKLTLQGPRLVLRPHLESDFEAIHGFSSDPDVCRFMQWGPNTEEQTRSFLESTILNQRVTPKVNYDFLIVVAETSQVVGSFTLRLGKADSQLGEIGYVLSRQSWGQGYASEAANLVMDFGFNELGLHKISATCEPLNFASAKVLQKAGLRPEGYLRKHLLIKGQWRDTLIFGCVKEERAANIADLNLKPHMLSVGEVTAVPLPQFPRVSMAPLARAFAGGSVHNLFMRAGARLGPLTNPMDEYLVLLNGVLTIDGRKVEKGAILFGPGCVPHGPYEAADDCELLVIRLGPPGEAG